MKWRSVSFRQLTLMVALAWACGDNPLGPYQPQINNVTDNFQLQATGVTNLTTTSEYTWQNTGVKAKLNPSTTTSSGTAMVALVAPGNAQVLSTGLMPSGDVISSVGTAGSWTIRLVLTNYTGTLNFRVQKEP